MSQQHPTPRGKEQPPADGPTNAVREVILAPILDLYVPPPQVRYDRRARERALAEYTQALAPFSRSTLSKAWELVRETHELSIWPSPGVIARACRQCARQTQAPSQDEAKRQQALDLADAYTAKYMQTSTLAKLARQEHWAGRLQEYVAAASWLQAQLLCGVQQIGWDRVLLPEDSRHRSSQEAFAAIREDMARPVEKGTIRVTVPPERIRQWKELAQHQRTAGA